MKPAVVLAVLALAALLLLAAPARSDGLALQAWVMRRWDAKQDTGHKA